LKREDEERLERKKKLEMIMKRVKTDEGSLQKQPDTLSNSPAGSMSEGINREPGPDNTVEQSVVSHPPIVSSLAPSTAEGATSQFRSPLLRQIMGSKLGSLRPAQSNGNEAVFTAESAGQEVAPCYANAELAAANEPSESASSLSVGRDTEDSVSEDHGGSAYDSLKVSPHTVSEDSFATHRELAQSQSACEVDSLEGEPVSAATSKSSASQSNTSLPGRKSPVVAFDQGEDTEEDEKLSPCYVKSEHDVRLDTDQSSVPAVRDNDALAPSPRLPEQTHIKSVVHCSSADDEDKDVNTAAATKSIESVRVLDPLVDLSCWTSGDVPSSDDSSVPSWPNGYPSADVWTDSPVNVTVNCRPREDHTFDETIDLATATVPPPGDNVDLLKTDGTDSRPPPSVPLIAFD
jgi:hypothetical protein